MKTELDYARQLADLIEEIRKAPGCGNFSGDGEVWIGPFIVHYGYGDDDPVTLSKSIPSSRLGSNRYEDVPRKPSNGSCDHG